MVRPFALLVCATLLQGCCCCGGGGGGGGGMSSKMEEWAAEKAAEKMVEVATGGEMDVDMSKKQFTITTDGGTMTTKSDGSLPEGFPHALPDGARVDASVRFDGKGDSEGVTMLSVFYRVDGPPKTQSEYWEKVGEAAGYDVRSLTTEGVDAMAQAREQGVTLPPAEVMGTNIENMGDFQVWQGPDEDTYGSVMVGEDEGETVVYVSIMPRGSEGGTPAEATP